MATDRVVLLTSEGESGRVAARYLAARFPALAVIVETPVSRSLLLRRRIKRLGPVQVGGQLAFMLFQRIQQRLSKSRIAEIVRNADLDARWPDDAQIIMVPSVNSAECIGHLQRLQPRAILVMGTRIIGAEVLRSVDAPFINYHAGVTPKYRGVHGGYWAKAQGDADNFGVTIHLVDEGIDTGGILYQARPATTARDNYSSYPYLQLAAGLPLLERSARDAISGTLKPQRVDLPSRLWSHPTLWGYIQTGLQRGVW
jgi:folate-dependent phosphoribosylglycinamide formyltransferase PurN